VVRNGIKLDISWVGCYRLWKSNDFESMVWDQVLNWNLDSKTDSKILLRHNSSKTWLKDDSVRELMSKSMRESMSESLFKVRFYFRFWSETVLLMYSKLWLKDMTQRGLSEELMSKSMRDSMRKSLMDTHMDTYTDSQTDTLMKCTQWLCAGHCLWRS